MGGSQPSKPQYQTPVYKELSLPELRTAITKFLGQEGDFQALQNTIESSATKRLDSLEKVQPGYKAGLAKAQQVADSYAAGLFPDDVATKISRSAAFKGLSAGLQGPQRQTIEARDFGKTSADLQIQGLNMQQSLRNEANAQMPLQALNLAFSPQAIRAEDVNLAQYNNQIYNRQQDAAAQIYNRQQDANYAYDSQYGGSPLGGILGGVGGGLIGAGAGYAMSGGNPMGAMMGGGMGSALGGGVGGAFGGARGQQFGGIFSSVGSTIAGLGMMNSGMGSGSVSGGGYTPVMSNSFSSGRSSGGMIGDFLNSGSNMQNLLQPQSSSFFNWKT